MGDESIGEGGVYSLHTVNTRGISGESLEKLLEKLLAEMGVNIERIAPTLVYETRPLSIRIHNIYHAIYKHYVAHSVLKRKVLKEIVERAIVRLAGMPDIRLEQQVVVNVAPQINIVNKAEARAESCAKAKIEVSPLLLKKLADLEDLLDFIAYRSSYPSNIRTRAAEGLAAVRTLRSQLSSN